MLKSLTVLITTNYDKFLKGWEYQTTLPTSWEICIQVRKQQLEQDMEKWTGSKLRKKYIKAVYCHLVYLTYMQNTFCERLGWMNHKQDSQEKYQLSHIHRWYHPYGRKKTTTEPLDEIEREE